MQTSAKMIVVRPNRQSARLDRRTVDLSIRSFYLCVTRPIVDMRLRDTSPPAPATGMRVRPTLSAQTPASRPSPTWRSTLTASPCPCACSHMKSPILCVHTLRPQTIAADLQGHHHATARCRQPSTLTVPKDMQYHTAYKHDAPARGTANACEGKCCMSANVALPLVSSGPQCQPAISEYLGEMSTRFFDGGNLRKLPPVLSSGHVCICATLRSVVSTSIAHDPPFLSAVAATKTFMGLIFSKKKS